MILGWNPHQGGDHRNRYRCGELSYHVHRSRFENAVEDRIRCRFELIPKCFGRAPSERFGNQTSQLGVAGWLQVDERFSDVLGPRGLLRRIDASVEVGVNVFNRHKMSEVTAEPTMVLEDGRDIIVSGNESKTPGLVIEHRRLLPKTGIGWVWIVLKDRVVRVKGQRASPLM